jgi:hypothetical protein
VVDGEAVSHKTQPSPIRELFFEAWRELSNDGENVQLKQDQEPVDAAILCLFCRISTHLKAIETLYHSGLALEADVMLRGCLESVFWMGALINKPSTVTDMENQYNFQRQTMAKNLLTVDPAVMELNAETLELMAIVRAEKQVKRNDLTSIFDVARLAGIPDLYLSYSELSNSAAHASLHSLNRHLVVKEDKSLDYFTVLVTDPKWDQIFHLGCCITFFTKNFFIQRFNSSGRQWENGMWDRLQKMIER